MFQVVLLWNLHLIRAVLSIIMCKLWSWRSTFGDDNLHLAFIGPVIAKLKFIGKWRIFMKFLFTQVLIGMGSLDFSEKKTKNTKNTTNVSWKQSFLNNRWTSVCNITLFKWRFNIYDLLKKIIFSYEKISVIVKYITLCNLYNIILWSKK